MLIITAGQAYTEIDVLACAIAYQNLLELKGVNSQVVLPGPFNETVPKRFKRIKVQTQYDKVEKDTQFIIVDCSDPKYFSSFVDVNKVVKLFDHHFGFEKYWKTKLGSNSVIERVGACATLVWEEFKKEKLDKKINQESIDLLYATIIGHSLNFRSSVSTKRDEKAAAELKKLTSLPGNWPELYFTEISKEMTSQPESCFKLATKRQIIKGDEKILVQFELWDASDFVQKNKQIVSEYLETFPNNIVLFSSPSIVEDKTYFIARNEQTKDTLLKILNVKFKDNAGHIKGVYQRKEIIRRLREL